MVVFKIFHSFNFRENFVADERFHALLKEPQDWTLQIKFVQIRDAGVYECQAATEPKVSARVYLHVVGKEIIIYA